MLSLLSCNFTNGSVQQPLTHGISENLPCDSQVPAKSLLEVFFRSVSPGCVVWGKQSLSPLIWEIGVEPLQLEKG